MPSDRPVGITLIAGYYILYGLLSLVVGIFASSFGFLTICFGPALLANGIWNVVNGVLNLILGASAWTGKDWARFVISLLAILGIIVNVLSLLNGFAIGALFNAAVNALVLLYMQSGEAKHFFATN